MNRVGAPELRSHTGEALVKNRHGLCVDIATAEANGRAERATPDKLSQHFL